MTGSSTDIDQQNTLVSSGANPGIHAALYYASLELTRANSSNEVRDAVSRALAASPFPALLVVAQQDEVSGSEMFTPYRSSNPELYHPYYLNRLPDNAPLFPLDIMETSLTNQSETDQGVSPAIPYLDCRLLDLSNTATNPIVIFLQGLGFVSAALIPVYRVKHLEMLILLGSSKEILNREHVQPYIGLADLAKSAFERLNFIQVLERRLTTLQSLNAISQVVALQADLDELFRVIHKEVDELFGDVSFFIALYNAKDNLVEIPYLYEMGSEQVTKPPPFVLGVGLTSLVIQKREPIMIVKDAQQRLMELGAQQTGLPARSWLGVPMLVAGEATGAIVIQDLFHELKFNEDDLQLMMTIASQVAITVRYVNLLKDARLQADRERTLYEITAQIRSSTDAQKILQTAAREVSRVVGARRTKVIISPSDEYPVAKKP